jgi:glucose-1-phosphate thymidylyltransferase
MLMGIREILIIVSPAMLPIFESHFEDGSKLGVSISYATQLHPVGLPDAFILGSEFISDDSVTLILGDNFLHGTGLGRNLRISGQVSGAVISTYQVSNPEDYGVLEFDKNGKIIRIIEKPKTFVSNWAIPGLYTFDNSVVEKSKKLSPSPRGELEITDLLRAYLSDGKLEYRKLERGTAWLDMGNPKSLLEACNFVSTIQDRQGLLIGDPYEVAWRNEWIAKENYEQYSLSAIIY